MKIYTKSGDDGETGLFGGGRVPKDSLRIEAYGTVDELNSHLGIVRSLAPSTDLDEEFARLQGELFVLGADLAAPAVSGQADVRRIGQPDIDRLERAIDMFDAQVPLLRTFILPGGSPASAHLHVARTVCRRAERCVVRLAREEKIGNAAVIYLNRLSDLLFVLARVAGKRAGAAETNWSG
jgi:cob(I)alamin adenosyltransferase